MSLDLKLLREIKISCDSHRKKMRRESLLFFLDSEDSRTISIKLISDNRGRLIKIQNKYLKGFTCSGCSQIY